MKNIHSLFAIVLFATSSLNAQWTQMTAPNGGGINYTCMVSTDSAFMAGSNGLGIHRSTNDGLNWFKIPNATIEASTRTITAMNGKIYIGTSSTGVHVTADNGNNWTALSTGMSNKMVNSISSFGRYMYAAGMTFYRSVDEGANWAAAGTGLPAAEIYSLIVTDGKVIASVKNSGLYASTDSGATFSAYNSNLSSLSTKNIIQKGTKLFLVLSNSVVVSTDYGASWQAANGGLPTGIASILTIFTYGDKIFIGTFGSGCYYTSDDGASWSAANTGLTPVNVRGFAVKGGYIFCGADNLTGDAGIWRRPLSDLTVSIDDPSEVPVKFSLKQNYPNPFNPSTTIEFILPVKSYVSLKIYNTLGQEVETLLSKEMNAGQHHIQWNAGRLSGGVYFYKLSANNYSETRKLLLVK